MPQDYTVRFLADPGTDFLLFVEGLDVPGGEQLESIHILRFDSVVCILDLVAETFISLSVSFTLSNLSVYASMAGSPSLRTRSTDLLHGPGHFFCCCLATIDDSLEFGYNIFLAVNR